MARSSPYRVHAAERFVHEAPAAQSVQEPRRRNEVAVEDLDERKKGGEQDRLSHEARGERSLESRLSPQVSRDEALPGKDEGDSGDDHSVEERKPTVSEAVIRMSEWRAQSGRAIPIPFHRFKPVRK